MGRAVAHCCKTVLLLRPLEAVLVSCDQLLIIAGHRATHRQAIGLLLTVCKNYAANSNKRLNN